MYTGDKKSKRGGRPAYATEPGCKHALDLFLASHMLECEEYCHKSDPQKERMYFSSGYRLIQCVKALMSFEDDDLLSAIGHTKHGNQIAQLHRKKAASITSRLAGFVVGSSSNSGVGFIKAMTPVERHAELIYAETLFEKALLGIMYSGDWLAFIKEALNLRTTVNTYRDLGKYLDAMDAEAIARGEPYDKSIDADFRSGVYLGVGSSNMYLSLMPSKLLHIMEIFGFKGDRMEGLRLLAKAGGWEKDKDEPSVEIEGEGVRRALCDMSLMIFHLVLSSFTVHGVDIPFAQKILDWNLKRYPNGVFFLFGQGRIRLIRGQPALAIESYQKAMAAQSQYRNLHHISNWEMAIANIALWDIAASAECWRMLEKEATWSKSCYAYGIGVCLLQMAMGRDRGRDGDKEKEGKRKEYEEEARKFIKKAPGVAQRIAGKSIPVEKFIARKARKFETQQGRLVLPALEFGYFFLVIKYAPRKVILQKMLPEIEDAMVELRKFEKKPEG